MTNTGNEQLIYAPGRISLDSISALAESLLHKIIFHCSLLKVHQCSKLPYEKLSLKRAQMRSPTQDGESVPPYNLCLPMHKQKCAPQIGGQSIILDHLSN